ncbi:MAG: hypothetical protein PHC88_10265 [Terrimicrobiaceae bacterium]|nr:hypothetical protein [Terrimicrobiaceae bacterium]
MARCAIDAVQLEFVLHRLAGEETPELRDPHLPDVLERHVISHQRVGRVDVGIGKAQPRQDPAREFGAYGFVAVESNAPRPVALESRRFSDVVEQDAERQRKRRGGRQQAEHDARVDEYVALGMEFGWLLAALERLDLGQQLAQQSALVEQIERSHPARVGEHFRELIANALGAHGMDLRRARADGIPGAGLDLEPQPRGKTNSAQQSQTVLREALRGIADGPDDAGVEVGAPADEIQHLLGRGVVKKAVHCEVAPAGVALGVGKGHGGRVASVEVFAIGTEGRDLIFAAVFEHHDHTELRADRDRAPEQAFNLRGPGARGDVIVLGVRAEQQVPHAAAGEVGLVPGGAQCRDDLAGGGFHRVSMPWQGIARKDWKLLQCRRLYR